MGQSLTAQQAQQQKLSLDKLPARVLTYSLEWLDSKSLGCSGSVCRKLCELQATDRLWHLLYVQEFEAHSADDECIAVDGETTAWRTRFRNRTRVERNRRKLRFRTSDVRPTQRIEGLGFAGSLLLYFTGPRRDVGALQLPTMRFVWALPLLDLHPVMIVDGVKPKLVLADDARIVVLDACTGNELREWRHDASQRSGSMAAGKQLLVVGMNDSGLELFDMERDERARPHRIDLNRQLQSATVRVTDQSDCEILCADCVQATLFSKTSAESDDYNARSLMTASRDDRLVDPARRLDCAP